MAAPRKRGNSQAGSRQELSAFSSSPQSANVPTGSLDFTPIQNATKQAAEQVRQFTDELQVKAAEERAAAKMNQLVEDGQNAADIKPVHEFGTIPGVKAYNRSVSRIHAQRLQEDMDTEIRSLVQSDFFSNPPVPAAMTRQRIAQSIQDAQSRLNATFGGDVPPEMNVAMVGVVDRSRKVANTYQLAVEDYIRNNIKIQERRMLKTTKTNQQREIQSTVDISNGVRNNRMPAERLQQSINSINEYVDDRIAMLQADVDNKTIASKEATRQRRKLENLRVQWIEQFTGKNNQYISKDDGSIALNRGMAIEYAAEALGTSIGADEIADELSNINNFFATSLVDAALKKAKLVKDPLEYLNVHNQIAKDLLSDDLFDANRELIDAIQGRLRDSAGSRSKQLGVYPMKAIEQLLSGDLRAEALSEEVASAAGVARGDNAMLPERFERVVNWTGALDVAAGKDTVYSNPESRDGIIRGQRALFEMQEDIHAAFGTDDPKRSLSELSRTIKERRNEIETMPNIGEMKAIRKKMLDRFDLLARFVDAPTSEDFANKEITESILGGRSGFGVGEANLAEIIHQARVGELRGEEFQDALKHEIKMSHSHVIQYNKVLRPEFVGLNTVAQAELKSMFTDLFNSTDLQDVGYGLEMLATFDEAMTEMGAPTAMHHIWTSTELNKVAPGALLAASAYQNGLDVRSAASLMQHANRARAYDRKTFDVSVDDQIESFPLQQRTEDEIESFPLQQRTEDEIVKILNLKDTGFFDTVLGPDVDEQVSALDVTAGGKADAESIAFFNDAINGFLLQEAGKGIKPEDALESVELKQFGEHSRLATMGWHKLSNGQAVKIDESTKYQIESVHGGSVEDSVNGMSMLLTKEFIGGVQPDAATMLQMDEARLESVGGGMYMLTAPSQGTMSLRYPIYYRGTKNPVLIHPAAAAKNADRIFKKVNLTDKTELGTNWRDLLEITE